MRPGSVVWLAMSVGSLEILEAAGTVEMMVATYRWYRGRPAVPLPCCRSAGPAPPAYFPRRRLFGGASHWSSHSGQTARRGINYLSPAPNPVLIRVARSGRGAAWSPLRCVVWTLADTGSHRRLCLRPFSRPELWLRSRPSSRKKQAPPSTQHVPGAHLPEGDVLGRVGAVPHIEAQAPRRPAPVA